MYKGGSLTHLVWNDWKNIYEEVREIHMALLAADVNYEVAKEFTKNVKKKH